MAALPSDIAASLRARSIASVEDATIKARFPSARDNSKDAAEGFFDSLTDAQTALAQRASLLGAVRRRFEVVAGGVIDITDGAVPTHRVIDTEQGLDALMIAARIEIDMEQDESKVEYFG
ncbi:hypothetical protein [Sphingobium sp. KCTC 72723]|uniref:hypothetical protein n=1 Tax=Sphingobium sp. KCTC 72723 TaxID=2733867 RepID=UPI00165E5F4E|nr:hypothetical protein [Sphingobium sp. KCTC 72723]